MAASNTPNLPRDPCLHPQINPPSQLQLDDLLNDCLSTDDIADLEFKYYNISELNHLYKEHHSKMGFTFFHVNIRSLSKNGDSLLDFISSYSGEFDAYILSEIWTTNIEFYNNLIPGYSFHYLLPASSRAGGVAIYCKDSIPITPRMDIQVVNDNFELLCVELNIPNFNKITVCCIYRHPGSSVTEFTSMLIDKLSMLSTNQYCILVGDINIDLKHYTTCNSTKMYVDELVSRNFLPLVSLPTRITANTATIIDHVFINNLNDQKIKTGLIATDISDHLANFVFFLKPTRTSPSERPKIRIYSQYNFDIFYSKLYNTSWEPVFSLQDPNKAYDFFYHTFYKIFDESFPLVIASRKWAKQKSWLTPALKISVARKSQLYKIWINNKNFENERTYKNYSNKLKQLIRMAKRKYFTKLFSERSNSIKNIWGAINRTFAKNTRSNFSKISEISNNGVLYKENVEIANIFADFFSNIGNNLAKQTQTQQYNYRDFLPIQQCHSIYIAEINAEEIRELIANIKCSKSSGPDLLNGFIIKKACDFILAPLVFIFNLSLSHGIFPDRLKISRVIPVFKKGDKTDCSNYRPIAISSIFSKLFEKLICNKLTSYFTKFNLLYEYQFGFRENFSTSLALMEVVNMIYSESKNNYVLGIFIDLQKAFDTVNHEILLGKLANMGIRGNILQWIKSYLNNREIYTFINGSESNRYPINIGVPQGSVLSPLLFLVYINDFYRALNDTKLRLFADDSNAFVISDNLTELFNKANYALKLIQIWLAANQLSLNYSKTNYILFKPSTRDVDYITANNLELKIDNYTIKKVSSAKYLGIEINENLTWIEHINVLVRKISSYSGIFYKYRDFIDPAVGKMLYYSYIYSRVNYGIELYGNSRNYITHPLNIACNRVLRILQCKPLLYPTSQLYRNYNTFPIGILYNMSLLKVMHKCIYTPNAMPTVIRCKVCQHRNIHNYSTRHANDFHFSTNYISNDPLSFATHLWNKMPNYIKLCINYRKFIQCLRAFYCNNII